MEKKGWLYILLPLIILASIALGVYIGYRITTNSLEYPLIQRIEKYKKLEWTMELIGNHYVDSIPSNIMIERAIPNIVKSLDPHSLYIPSKKSDKVNAELKKSFGGIGISYQVCEDTIFVINIIKNGPADKAKIKKFDRIISINSSKCIGTKIKKKKFIEQLRGKIGSSINLGIIRKTKDTTIVFYKTLKRAPISQKSIDVFYRINPNIGYIEIKKFGENTYSEFMEAIQQLKKDGCKKFLIDLRNNGGGWMNMAITMINEFLPAHQLIVYTEGYFSLKNESFSDGNGNCINNPVAVLINENSASASEIFAGAIQDNDRGLIIGRRSFGKGLVQAQIPYYKDSSAIRLTIARYHTPSGRCIQKPYVLGEQKEYANELYKRFKGGEFSFKDSLKINDSLKFKTVKGRTVYGGGGIIPDIFVPLDTSFSTSYSMAIQSHGLLESFACRYAEANFDSLSRSHYYWTLLQMMNRDSISVLEQLVRYVEKKGLRRRPYAIDLSGRMLEIKAKALIANIIAGQNAAYPINGILDNTYRRAIKELKTMRNELLKTRKVTTLLPIKNDSIGNYKMKKNE